MSIDPIKHFILNSNPTIHDEEAMTSLQLSGRLAAKMNEVIALSTQLEKDLNAAIASLGGMVGDEVEEMYNNGELAEILNTTVMNTALSEIRRQIANLRNELNSIIAEQILDTSANTELINARAGLNGKSYTTTGEHIRAIENGSGFSDAVRPGTVRAGRIFPGMLGGELKDLAKGEAIIFAGHWNGEKGYYDRDTKEFIAHTGYAQTDKVPCAYGDMFKLKSYIYGALVSPAAVFDSSGNVLEVLGTGGVGDWEYREEIITVSNANAAYISFFCGTGYVADFRASRYSILPRLGEGLKTAGGYWRMRAKKRTDTITDRAQIKCWFPLPVNRGENDVHHVRINAIKLSNVKSYTVRLFAAATDSTYDENLSFSASGYEMSPLLDMHAFFTVPMQTAEGANVNHVCMFIDFVPYSDNYMDVELYPPYLNGAIKGINPALHGGLDTDNFMDVRPGSELFGTFKKNIVGCGDSLMSGNNLHKSLSWFNRAAGALGMQYYNAGANGSPIAATSQSNTAMVTRIDSILSTMTPDYFILQGGANDKRYNVTIDAFKAAIREIVDKVWKKSPRCKILLATNWRRTDSPNTIGLYDSDYVAAMVEIAEEMGIPAVNNYSAGINLLDTTVSAWADEGLVSGGTANIHFSIDANKAITEKYIPIIAGL